MNNERLECPICGRLFKDLKQHLKKAHDMSDNDIKNSFGNIKLVTDELKEQRHNHASQIFINYNKTQWDGEDGERRKKRRSECARECISEHQDVMLAGRQTQEFHDKRSALTTAQLKRQWCEDEEYRNKALNNLFNNFNLKQYDNGMFRSSWESQMAKNLDMIGVSYEYESLHIKYINENNKKRTYIPDFYIRDMNTIIEVKCDWFRDSDDVYFKISAARDQGYKCFLAYWNEVFNNFLEFWNTVESATTIESVAN